MMAMWNDYEKIARRLDRIANAFERIANALETANIIEADRKTEPRIKTADYCDICNHKGCENCVADSRDDYCVPSNYEPTKQTEPQTDCAWQNDEFIPTELASTMLKNRFKEQK